MRFKLPLTRGSLRSRHPLRAEAAGMLAALAPRSGESVPSREAARRGRRKSQAKPLPPVWVTITIFALAFLIPAYPWLSGAVTIPWDAKSQFFPQVQFVASSIARGEWPWWTSNVFAGWPQIADPQSLMFSPLHLLLAWIEPSVSLRAFDATSFAYLFLGGLGIVLFFHDRGWHPGGALVAALAFAFGGSASGRIQHTVQIISLAFFPLTLWLLARALDRASWRVGLAAGVTVGLLAIGRDQVALLSLYVLAGFVLWGWFTRDDIRAAVRTSIKPLAAAGTMATIIAALPVMTTALLAARSNRPEVDYASAAAGSLHPVHLLQFAFADLFGAMDPSIEYWAPQSAIWDAAWGSPGLYLSQNMGLLYAGALVLVAIISFGFIRGLAFAQEIRFFTIAATAILLYMLGGYTPAFHLLYEILPGVDLYRRTADASFVLVALIAIVAGYLVHRWLTDTIAPATRMQRALEAATTAFVIVAALALAHSVVGVRAAATPVVTGIVFTTGAVVMLALARRLATHRAAAACSLLALFMALDLAINNAPHVSTALPPREFDALRKHTGNETVRILKERLEAAGAPDRRDRVEMIGMGYEWPNLSLAHGLDQVFGHNPLRLASFFRATHSGDTVAIPSQRWFSPLYPSYRSAFADLLGVRLIATGVPVEEIDSSLKPGDLEFIARTADAYIYENRRALPRVLLLTQWRLADFNELTESGWPTLDPSETVLLERAPEGFTSGVKSGVRGTAQFLRYANTEVLVQAEASEGGILVLNDVWSPWWRASVNGKQVDILKANVIFRAVVVPPGRHLVRFSYHPVSGPIAELMEKIGL
jgi:hypothetical protein